jgi:hypothetical protein
MCSTFLYKFRSKNVFALINIYLVTQEMGSETHVQCQLLLFGFNQNWYTLPNLSKLANIKFHENDKFRSKYFFALINIYRVTLEMDSETHVQCQLLLSGFNQNWYTLPNFIKTHQYQIS